MLHRTYATDHEADRDVHPIRCALPRAITRGSSRAGLEYSPLGAASRAPLESLGAERRGIGERLLSCHHLGQQPPGYRAEREAVMLMAEVEPQARMSRRGPDHRQEVWQARPPPEPGLRVDPLSERKRPARQRLHSVEHGGRRRRVAQREFRAGGQPHSLRHRGDEIAAVDVQYGMVEHAIAGRPVNPCTRIDTPTQSTMVQ